MLTFDHYLTPATLEGAFDALERIPGARLVAGATDLLPWAREGRAGDVHLPALVDISRIPQLQGVSVERGRVHMGAATPIAAFQNDPLLQLHAPVLGCCAVWFADDQIREQATVGGNLVNASPAGDSQPALLAMNAGVTLARREGGPIAERSMPLSEFILGPGKTQLQPHEIMTRLQMDAVPGHGAAFEKVGHRRSLVISTVCLAALVRLDWAKRRIEDCRIAIGAVGPGARAVGRSGTLAGGPGARQRTGARGGEPRRGPRAFAQPAGVPARSAGQFCRAGAGIGPGPRRPGTGAPAQGAEPCLRRPSTNLPAPGPATRR